MRTVRTFRRFFATNDAGANFTAKSVGVTTEPSGDGTLKIVLNQNRIHSKLEIFPFLLGSDNDVSSVRIWRWSKAMKDGSTTLWVPSIIGEYSCTASAFVGVAGSAVLATERFCDTIAPVALLSQQYVIAAGTVTDSDVEIFSPANDTPGYIRLPVYNGEILELDVDQTTGTATFNCLYAFVDDE